MPSPGQIKCYTAGAAINASRIVKMGAADYAVLQSAAASSIPVGISQSLINAAIGDRIDVIESGEAALVLGGTVARGGRITADANGKGVATTTGDQSIGIAKTSGVTGDIIDCIIDRGIA